MNAVAWTQFDPARKAPRVGDVHRVMVLARGADAAERAGYPDVYAQPHGDGCAIGYERAAEDTTVTLYVRRSRYALLGALCENGVAVCALFCRQSYGTFIVAAAHVTGVIDTAALALAALRARQLLALAGALRPIALLGLPLVLVGDFGAGGAGGAGANDDLSLLTLALRLKAATEHIYHTPAVAPYQRAAGGAGISFTLNTVTQ